MPANLSEIEKRLWSAADEFRANSKLKSSEYSVPVLGLIFLRYADQKFTAAEDALQGQSSGRRAIGKTDYQARGVMYLPPEARFSYLVMLPEGIDIGKAVNDAMRSIEAENDDMAELLDEAVLDEAQERKLEREFGREYQLLTREERLDAIATDIVTHFLGRARLWPARTRPQIRSPRRVRPGPRSLATCG